MNFQKQPSYLFAPFGRIITDYKRNYLGELIDIKYNYPILITTDFRPCLARRLILRILLGSLWIRKEDFK